METYFIEYGGKDAGETVEIHDTVKQAILTRARELKEKYDKGQVGRAQAEVLEQVAGTDQPDLILSEAKRKLQKILEENAKIEKV